MNRIPITVHHRAYAAVRHIEEFKRLLFWSLTAVLLTLAFLYGYFILHSISEVLVRSNLEREIATLQSEVSELEIDYLADKNALTFEAAKHLGLGMPEEKLFVARKSFTVQNITLNE